MNSLFVLSLGGEVLIERHFRPSPTPRGRAPCDFFWSYAQKYDVSLATGAGGTNPVPTDPQASVSMADIPPVLQMQATGSGSPVYVLSAFRGTLIFLATCVSDHPPLLVLEFLHRVADIFSDYFGTPLDEELVKDNFATAYQLLEEMCDNGHPLTTEPNALQAMITPPTMLNKIQQAVTGASNVSSDLADGVVSNMPWRRSGVKYAQNEIYVDLVEEVDCIVDVNGQVVSSDINGSIQCQSKLSGVPDLTLTFKDPDVIDDCAFHPCVRYNRFDREKVISFVPPDGNFELMRYRVKGVARIVQPPVYCTPQMSYGEEAKRGSSGGKRVDGRISVIVGLRQTNSLVFPGKKGPMIVEDVVVTIPFPRVVKTANLSADAGSVLYDEATKVARWSIPKVDARKSPQLTGSMLLTGGRPEESPPIQLDWKIPMASVSGLAVSGLSVHNENYKPYKGVRTITKGGKFTVRCS